MFGLICTAGKRILSLLKGTSKLNQCVMQPSKMETILCSW
jgi:hypothetical protein